MGCAGSNTPRMEGDGGEMCGLAKDRLSGGMSGDGNAHCRVLVDTGSPGGM